MAPPLPRNIDSLAYPNIFAVILSVLINILKPLSRQYVDVMCVEFDVCC